jgi:predicted RNase H-like HicB family nuclease
VNKRVAKKPAKSRPSKTCKIIVERHSDGYVAYPLGLKGVVIGQGDTYEEALNDVKSAIRFHVKTFGKEAIEGGFCVLEAFVAETEVSA